MDGDVILESNLEQPNIIEDDELCQVEFIGDDILFWKLCEMVLILTYKNVTIEMTFQLNHTLVPDTQTFGGLVVEFDDNYILRVGIGKSDIWIGPPYYMAYPFSKAIEIYDTNRLRLTLSNNLVSIYINEQFFTSRSTIETTQYGRFGIVGCNLNMTVKALHVSNPIISYPNITSQNNSADKTFGISINITYIYDHINDTQTQIVINILSNITQIILFQNVSKSEFECVKNYQISIVNATTNNAMKLNAKIDLCDEKTQLLLIDDYKRNLETQLIRQITDKKLSVSIENIEINGDVITKMTEVSTTVLAENNKTVL